MILASSEMPPLPGLEIGPMGSTRHRMSSLQKFSSVRGPEGAELMLWWEVVSRRGSTGCGVISLTRNLCRRKSRYQLRHSSSLGWGFVYYIYGVIFIGQTGLFYFNNSSLYCTVLFFTKLTVPLIYYNVFVLYCTALYYKFLIY